ncbi:MAG: ATP-binding protein [Verrucomicrobiales bacterium]
MRDEVGELAQCLRALEECEAYQQMPPSLRFVTELVLDELVSNTIKYGGPGNHEITTTVDWNGQQLSVRIVDDALPFNPWEQSAMGELDDEEERESAPSDHQALKVGGRGLQMLRRATDTREYERTAGKNIVTVTRHLRRPLAA